MRINRTLLLGILVSMPIVSAPATAQPPPGNISILDPSKPNSNSTTLSPERQAALEAYMNSIVPNQIQNDLDASRLDKIILDGLFTEIVTDPRVTQARLDFSDIQFEQVTSILSALQSKTAALTTKKLADLCIELDSSSSDPNEIQSLIITDATSAVESSHINDTQDLLEEYQQAILEIDELLGTANSEIFQAYLSQKRNEAKSWRTIELPEILEILSRNQALELQCD